MCVMPEQIFWSSVAGLGLYAVEVRTSDLTVPAWYS